jgi:hypothetical protein
MSTLTLLLPSFALFGFAGVLLTQALCCVTGNAALIVRAWRKLTRSEQRREFFVHTHSGLWC